MKRFKLILSVCVILLLGLSLLTSGCGTTAKKPVQPTTPKVTTPATPAYPTATAKKAASEASNISGVNKATAVVASKRIYIGLDLKADLGSQTSADVEKKVADQVKKMNPGYTVVVTSDIDTVTRLKNVANGIAQGKPLTSFKNELQQIDTRLTPNTR